MANPSEEKAMEVIDDFEKFKLPSPWIQIRDRQKVAAQLRARVNNPFLINQGTSGTCGPAAITFEIARANPYVYVTAVTELYNSGYTRRRHQWVLKPCTDLLKASCPAHIAEADWIILASIRDSENWFFDVESDRDKRASGTKLGEIEDWFKNAGYTDVKKNEIYLHVRMNTIPNLRKSLKLYDDDYQVIWGICADCITSNETPRIVLWKGGVAKAPREHQMDHAVALAGTFNPPASESALISIPIFTWGRQTTIPEVGDLTYGQFLDQYYGYVAGKY